MKALVLGRMLGESRLYYRAETFASSTYANAMIGAYVYCVLFAVYYFLWSHIDFNKDDFVINL